MQQRLRLPDVAGSSLGDVTTVSLGLFRLAPGRLVGIAAVTLAPSYAVVFVALSVLSGASRRYASGEAPFPGIAGAWVAGTLLALVLYFAASVVAMLGSVAVTRAGFHGLMGRPWTPREVWREATSRLWTIVGAQVVLALALLAGLALCCLPALWIMAISGLFSVIVALEELGPFDMLRRAHTLFLAAPARFVGLWIVNWILATALGSPAGIVAEALAPEPVGDAVAQLLASVHRAPMDLLMGAIAAPVIGVVFQLLWLVAWIDARGRAEGYDLDLAGARAGLLTEDEGR
ncbi:hypothetical protein L6R50_14540 [Myxococcota bacterium]|nr:hypothetical protein [Myxococcota bacterium]